MKGEWASRDLSIRLLEPVCVPSATWFQRDLGRLLDLIHRALVVTIQRAVIIPRCPPFQERRRRDALPVKSA